MEMATIYSISRQKVDIRPVVDFYSYSPDKHAGALVEMDGGRISNPLEVNRSSAEIRKIRKADGSYAYIAVDPELEEIFSLTEKQRREAAESDAYSARRLLAITQQQHERWWSQPWYKRVIQAIKSK